MLEATLALTAMSEEADSDSVSEDKPYQPVSLSAGEVDDNERWDEYLEYIKEYQGPDVHKVDVSERHIITVRDNRGRPVPNAQVRVAVGEASHFEGRTYANGQTLFFPRSLPVDEGAESFQVSAEKGGVSRSLDFARGEATDWELTLDTEASFVGGVPLDVLFLLDSTGSMADEIDRIKDTLLSIASRIADLPSQPDLRFGMVSYRDRGDEYVTRLFDFDSDVRRFLVLQSQIRQAPFVMATPGSGLVAPSPPRPVQDEIRQLVLRPNQAGEQSAHLRHCHRNQLFIRTVAAPFSPCSVV